MSSISSWIKYVWNILKSLACMFQKLADQTVRFLIPSLDLPLALTQIKPTEVSCPYPNCVPVWTRSNENLGYAVNLSLITAM